MTIGRNLPVLITSLSPSLFRAPRLIQWITLLAIFFLLAMTVARAVAYVAFGENGASLAQSLPAFWLGFRFDARVVASLLLALLVGGSVRWFDPFTYRGARRFWLVLLTVFGGLLLLIYVVDFLHFRYLNQRLNASVLGFAADAQISAAMAWQTYPVIRIILGLSVGVTLVALTLSRLHHRTAGAPESPRKAIRFTWFAVAFLSCVVGIFGRVGQYPLRWSDAFSLRNDASANLALNPIQSFLSSLSFRDSGYDLAQVRAHQPRMSAYLGLKGGPGERPDFERRVPAKAAPGVPTARPLNVVLVLCESFSAYKSSMWGNPLNTTPFFAELCREGVFFDNCFTPHIGTARGVWATITGIPDVEPVETASRNPALVDQHTIINDFEGYEKFYFLGGSSSWANIRGLLTNNIRDLQLYEENSYVSPRIDVWGISDKNLFLEANDVLAKQTKPFFAIIQTADNHRPYTIPKEDLGEFRREELPAEDLKRAGFESNAELNAFRYTDFSFRKFMEAARAAPYFDQTVFVFIGDHGIGGNAGTLFPPAWTEHNLTCYHVPLLFYAPGRLPAQRIHSVASMVDVLPTIAGIVGIPYRNTTLGRDLLHQQQVDGGRSNVAFVVDHHSRSAGVIHGSYFGNHQRGGERNEVVWADFAQPAARPATPAQTAEYKPIAQAFYETARYLLLNNRKRPDHSTAASAH